jgi:hypothetical protein
VPGQPAAVEADQKIASTLDQRIGEARDDARKQSTGTLMARDLGLDGWKDAGSDWVVRVVPEPGGAGTGQPAAAFLLADGAGRPGSKAISKHYPNCPQKVKALLTSPATGGNAGMSVIRRCGVSCGRTICLAPGHSAVARRG